MTMAGGDFLPWNQETVPEVVHNDQWAMNFGYWLMVVQLLGISAGVVILLPPWHRLKRQQHPEGTSALPALEEPSAVPAAPSDGGTIDVEANAATPAAQKPSRKRLFYLDALKVFLMLLVIMQHTGEEFGDANGASCINLYACKDVYANLGSMTKSEAVQNCSIMDGRYIFPRFHVWFRALNETYFMELFFFVSGIFTPSSFDRKGLQSFLTDKFKRLGIPAVVWYFLLGPFFMFLTGRIVFGLPFRYGGSGTWLCMGAPWFIAWLLTFNVVYAFVNGAPVKIDLPNIGILLLTGSLMGVVILATGDKAVFNTPNGIPEIIPCALAFSCGILAKRSGWLEQLELMPDQSLWLLRALVVLYAGAFALYMSLLQKSVIDDIKFDSSDGYQLVIFQGMMLLVIPIVLVDFFRRFLNGGGRLMTIMSDATFLVYIIHPYVVTPVTWSFVALIRAGGAVVVRTQLSTEAFGGAYPYAFAVQSDSDVFLWLGWLYTLLVANTLVWPLARFLRKLPGLREVF
jgi:hypothetical protein